MIHSIAYHMIYGKPLIAYMGILTLSSLLFTAFISVSNVKFNYHLIPFKWHPRVAAVTITLALVHATLGVGSYFF
ncbi:MAG: hypothetical protein Q7S53_01685 [bacterium]|nr:hypothetical protein [bacterium]